MACGRRPCDLAGTGHPGLDELLGGGFARGQLSEIVGPCSSTRTGVLATVLAAATGRGEVVALIDPGDQFMPTASAASGLDLSRLLWVRGDGGGQPRDVSPSIARALTALELVIDTDEFGVAVLDLSHLSARQMRQVPVTAWSGLFRRLAGGQTSGLLLGPEPTARSAEGQVVLLRTPANAGAGDVRPPGAGARPVLDSVWEARVVPHRSSDAFTTFRGPRADA
ncbi:MAG: hypothetical protein ABGY72_19565 [bacterium]